jgi:hypothetical protein
MAGRSIPHHYITLYFMLCANYFACRYAAHKGFIFVLQSGEIAPQNKIKPSRSAAGAEKSAKLANRVI